MSDQKPKITLKIGGPKKTLEAQDQGATLTPTSATTATPKLTLKFGSGSAATPSTPKATPAPAGPKPSKSGRKPKPTAKKRTLDTAQADDNNDDDESDSEPLAKAKAAPSRPPIKRIKITTGGGAAAAKTKKAKAATTTTTTGTPSGPSILTIKHKGKIPERPLGVGYDSEASDREDDPTIEEALVLRMAPGDDCDYLRASIAANTFGVKKDVQLRFMTSNGRRACLTVRGRRYAAVLVDLPCVIEAMKSWNKKEWYKSADVCQMLLVLGRVAVDDEAITYDLKRAMTAVAGGGVLGKGELDEKTWAWAHGLTPPMRWVRKRRFRTRISTKLVEEDEREVERLLKDDADAKGGFTYRHLDLDALEREQAEAEAEEEGEYDDYEDADGEVEEGYGAGGSMQGREAGDGVMGELENDDDDDDDLEAHLEAEMLKQAHEGDAAAAAATLIAGNTITDSPAPTSGLLNDAAASPPLTASAAGTPSFEAARAAAAAGGTPSADDAAASSDVSDEDDDDDEDEDGDDDGEAPDDDALEEQQDRQRMREEIADLEAAIVREEQRLKITPNQILKQKIAKTIQGLKADLELKMGGGDDDEDDDGGGGGGQG